ncbi:MAG: hypothetical protein ACT6S0_23240, partial [Roseateles sp.]
MPHALSAPLIPPRTSGLDAAGSARWEGEAPLWRLVLAGDLSGAETELPRPPAELALSADTQLRVDSTALSHWQPPLAGALWQRLAPLARAGVRLDLG